MTLIATTEHYSNGTNLRPVPPPEANRLIQTHEPLPFAQNMWRYGAVGEWLLFSKSLLQTKKSLVDLVKAKRIKNRLELLSLQSSLVGLIANIHYVDALEAALKAHKRSLQKSLEDVSLKVSLQKAPPIAKLKIQNALNELRQKELGLMMQKEELENALFALVKSKEAPKIELVTLPKKRPFLALRAKEEFIKAAQKGLRASKERFLPVVKLDLFASHIASDKDVLFHKSVNRDYAYAKLGLYLPLSKENFTDIEQKRVELEKERFDYEALRRDLLAKEATFKKDLVLLQEALRLDKENVQNEQKLLRYAKLAFKIGRMNVEEYLRYEAALESAKSKLALDKKKRIELAAKLALLYGEDLRKIVRDVQ